MSGYALLTILFKLIGPCTLVGSQNLGTLEKAYRCGIVGVHEFKDEYQYSIDIYGLQGRNRDDVTSFLKSKSCKKPISCSFERNLIRIKETFK